jgi:hypothetical protein
MSSQQRRRKPVDATGSYSRHSTVLQAELSIERQQEKCRAAAVRDGKSIAPEMEFFDSAISGRSSTMRD